MRVGRGLALIVALDERVMQGRERISATLRISAALFVAHKREFDSPNAGASTLVRFEGPSKQTPRGIVECDFEHPFLLGGLCELKHHHTRHGHKRTAGEQQAIALLLRLGESKLAVDRLR